MSWSREDIGMRRHEIRDVKCTYTLAVEPNLKNTPTNLSHLHPDSFTSVYTAIHVQNRGHNNTIRR